MQGLVVLTDLIEGLHIVLVLAVELEAQVLPFQLGVVAPFQVLA